MAVAHDSRGRWDCNPTKQNTNLPSPQHTTLQHFLYSKHNNPHYCITTTGHLSGLVSERDIVQKVALLDCPTTAVRVKEISTQNNIITVDPDLSLNECMAIMIKKDIRHLPLVSDDTGVVVGMISIKDCVKIVIEEKEETIQVLTNFALGKTGNFVVD